MRYLIILVRLHLPIAVFPNLFFLCTPWAYLSYHEYPMLMILKKYNVTQVIIKCFHVPPAVCLRTPRGTRTPGWESLTYRIADTLLQGDLYEIYN